MATTRRDLLKAGGALAAGLACEGPGGGVVAADSADATAAPSVPSYLKGYEKLYAADPRKAAIEWFREAKFGLFMHYGLYSLLGRHEWVQLREKIPVAKYAKLKDRFTAEKFDADFIADLAVAARMKYVNITTRHHDSFCLFASKQTDFNSVNSPAKRDLVGELAEACRKKGLGLFLYYSHGRDWKHPHAPNRDRPDRVGGARPAYSPPEPTYKRGDEHDLQKYVDFMTAQITELLTNYGPVAGIWLDGINTTRGHKDAFKIQPLYDLIHRLQPQVLVSYKQGMLGTEDFFAPERGGGGVENPHNRPLEICDTLQPQGWGYIKADDGKHKSPEQVLRMLAGAAYAKANLLLNTGPLPDGSIHASDVKTLREVGRRIAADGWPEPAAPPPPKPRR